MSVGPIVLVGSMGAGKTTVGRLLARNLDRRFVDGDEQLRLRTGETAAMVASGEGVPALHEREAAILLEAVAAGPAVVVAAAASVADLPDLRARLPAGTRVVWLRARPFTLRQRALAGVHRPFVHGDPDAVGRLDHSRRGEYEALADSVIDVDDRSPDELARELTDLLS